DRGTTILLAGVSGIMLLIAGVRWRYIVPPVLIGLAGLAASLFFDQMRSRRILSWWYLEEHKSGVGYQAYQAMLALGAGGWTGRGLGDSRQKDRKSTRLNSSHVKISYAVFCLKKKRNDTHQQARNFKLPPIR